MEIDQLISYLINKENSDGVVLLGHSTGCQVAADFVLNLFHIQSLFDCLSVALSEEIWLILCLLMNLGYCALYVHKCCLFPSCPCCHFSGSYCYSLWSTCSLYVLSAAYVLYSRGLEKGFLLVCYHDHSRKNPAVILIFTLNNICTVWQLMTYHLWKLVDLSVVWLIFAYSCLGEYLSIMK